MVLTDSKTVFVTGGAGFIGSQIADRLLRIGCNVVCYDNLSTGMTEFIKSAQQSPRYKFIQGDLLDLSLLKTSMAGCEFVFHLAANADVRFGTHHPERDLEQNTIATFNVLEAMRRNSIRHIAFSSTGSIYGESPQIPTPEDAPFPIQTSLYGASKLAGEGLITAYCEGFDYQAWIFRFVSILGERYTHGHIFDFFRQLKDHPQFLDILGNGKQRKSYLYIEDCLDAITFAIENACEKVNIFNLGTNEYCEVNDSIDVITETMGVLPERRYSGGERGWIGDNPFIFLDCSKINQLGWKPKLTIRQAVAKTVDYIEKNQWIYTKRT